MSNVIFEVFSEEIPATLQKNIVLEYQKFSVTELKKLNISAENISVGITLNRMVLQFSSKNCDKEKLTSFIEIVLQNFSHSFPRTMLYPQSSIRWIRPIKSLYAVIDNEVLNGEFFGVKLYNGTYVRKFDYIECKTYDKYLSVLKKENIEIDYNKRLNFIETEIHNINPEYKNYSLMNEIAGMSESNTKPILDTLDKRFYILPFELIELVLRTNQRYVVFKPNENGEIKFLIFCDKNTEEVKKGHQKVITARLDDALFYWNLDDKIKKDNKQNLKDSLDEQIFIDDITWKKYMDKQNSIADILLKDNKTTLEQVKKLIVNTKLDLITGVVREFPELQGIIGRYYFGYKINPYIYDNNAIDLDILYYYFIDRIAYIQVMFQQGKQPTGSGDKYKVKNRMDDIVKAVVKLSNTVEISKLLVLIKANNEIYKLFQKRYQKYTEAELSEENKDIVKVIADSCIKALSYDRIYTEVKTFAKNLQNTAFVKTYKRLNGYTNDCRLKITNETDEEIYKYINDILGINYKQNQNINILENEKIINNINNFLDNTKISENEILKKALVIIQKTLFEKQLPIEMI